MQQVSDDDQTETLIDQADGIMSSLEEMERMIALKRKQNQTIAQLVDGMDNKQK